MQPQAIFVIFGQAGWLEDQVVLGGGQLFERCARISGPYSVGRNKTSHELARRHILELPFGEFVAVDGVDYARERRGERQYGNLHHVVMVRVNVDAGQRVGMNQIFGVVRDDDLEPSVVMLLE